MKLKLYSIRDIQTNQYGNPMTLVSNGQAIRTFSTEVNREDKTNMMYTNPEDFELYQVGEFETETGIITATQPEQIATAKNLKT